MVVALLPGAGLGCSLYAQCSSRREDRQVRKGKSKVGLWYNQAVILRRLNNARRILDRGLYILVIFALLACAVSAIFLGIDGANDANWTGAMVAICAATLLFLGTRFKPKLDARDVARGLGIILAVPAAWFWLVSAQQEPDTLQWMIAAAVVITLTLVAIFVVIATVCVWFSGWLSSRWPGR